MRELTPRQRKVIRERAKGKTLKQAGIDAGYSPNGAAVQACNVLKKDNAQQALAAALEKAGISDEMIANKLFEGMKSTTLVGKDAIEHADNHARLKAVDLAIKVKGAYAPTASEMSGPDGGAVPFAFVKPEATRKANKAADDILSDATGK